MCSISLFAVLNQQNGEEIRIPHALKPLVSPPFDPGNGFLDEIIAFEVPNATVSGGSPVFGPEGPPPAKIDRRVLRTI